MAVIIETSIGDLTIDLYTEERPNCSKNFLKLCKIKYYNFSLFHCVQRNFIAQTGDPTGTGRGGESVYFSIYGEQARYFDMEKNPIIKHRRMGSISMVNNGSDMHGSQFFVTLGENLDSLDGRHTVFGFVSEGLDTLGKLSEVYCDREGRPYQDVRILHTVVLDDPFEDPRGLPIPDRSPSPTKEMLESGRLRIDEEIDGMKDKPKEEVDELIAQKEARARATILEMIGDIPDSEVKPPDNVLFVCKLNPVTSDEDLEVIFSRFGSILCCEVIRDQKTGDSLCYAFIEFENREDCETAYFKMDNVLIDDRRIHVDFSQSVSKVRWMGKGTGTGHFADGRDFRDKKKNAVDIYEDEPDELPWKLKEQKRGGKQYDLVFSDEEGDGKKSPSSRKRKQRPQSRSRSPDRREQPREQPSEGKRERRSRSRERERRERDSRENRDRENRDNRDRERERDRDREREKEKERERNRESDKFRDRRERDRRRSPERHQRSHRD